MRLSQIVPGKMTARTVGRPPAGSLDETDHGKEVRSTFRRAKYAKTNVPVVLRPCQSVPITYCVLPTTYCLLPIAYCILPIFLVYLKIAKV